MANSSRGFRRSALRNSSIAPSRSPLLPQREAQIVMGHIVVGIQPYSLSIFSRGAGPVFL